MGSAARLTAQVLLNNAVQKTNESPDECQDACAVNARLGRYAVADGVGQTFYPAEWARLLVEHFCNDDAQTGSALFASRNWREWLAPVQQKWDSEIRARVERKTDPEAFHLRNSLARGEHAGAAFAGLQIAAQNQAEWQAMIIGDCCLFHVSEGRLVSHLLKDASSFDTHPDYFASRSGQGKSDPSFVSGVAKAGDMLILATDALAKWLIVEYQMGGDAWQTTLAVLTRPGKWSDVYEFIQRARRDPANRLEDDDVALLAVAIAEGKAAGLEGLLAAEPPALPVGPIGQPISVNRGRASAAGHGADLSGFGRQPVREPSGGLSEGANRRLDSTRRIAVVALTLALAATVVSLLNLYKTSVDHPSARTPTPISYFGTPTSTPVLARGAASATPGAVTLEPGTLCYLRPDLSSQTILSVENGTQATLVGSETVTGRRWDEIQIDLWVVSSVDGLEYSRSQSGMVLIRSTVNARATAMRSASPIGTLFPGVALQQVGEFTDATNTKWYQVRVAGFVIRGR